MGELSQETRPGCLKVLWTIPVHIRLAIGCGICAGSLTSMAIEYWLLEMRGIGFEPQHIVMRIAVVIVPGLLVFGLISWVASYILRPR